jgi:hypothetical protein
MPCKECTSAASTSICLRSTAAPSANLHKISSPLQVASMFCFISLSTENSGIVFNALPMSRWSVATVINRTSPPQSARPPMTRLADLCDQPICNMHRKCLLVNCDDQIYQAPPLRYSYELGTPGHIEMVRPLRYYFDSKQAVARGRPCDQRVWGNSSQHEQEGYLNSSQQLRQQSQVCCPF